MDPCNLLAWKRGAFPSLGTSRGAGSRSCTQALQQEHRDVLLAVPVALHVGCHQCHGISVVLPISLVAAYRQHGCLQSDTLDVSLQ